MPEFKDREEYERWKADKLKQNEAKRSSGDSEKPQSIPPSSSDQARQAAPNGLPEIGDLLTRSWELFKARIGVLLPLQLLSIAALIVCIAAAAGIGEFFALLLPAGKTPILVISVITGVTAGMTAMFWPIAALIFAVADRSLSVRGALSAGWKKFWAFFWLFSIMAYVIAGGYLLFIIPGIIFTIWFSFSQYILATENVCGMNALLKSKAYVKDRWFDVFIRFLVIWAISTGLGMIPFLGIILSFLAAPFTMIYSYLLYEELKALNPAPPDYPKNSGEKLKWIGIATLGYIVLPLIIIAIVGAACMLPLLILKGINLQQVPPPQRFF
ncbi:MAG: hypothetical protein HZB31_05385 [Nitrospirae bacterium]|nr:hypothetical protein [Nitrospirota bacterium]